MKRKQILEQLEFILKVACQQGWVTSFHLNDDYPNFLIRFYPENMEKGEKAFVRRVNKLVELGFLKQGEKAGTGVGGYYDFGVKVVTTWEIENKYFHNFKEALTELHKKYGGGK